MNQGAFWKGIVFGICITIVFALLYDNYLVSRNLEFYKEYSEQLNEALNPYSLSNIDKYIKEQEAKQGKN